MGIFCSLIKSCLDEQFLEVGFFFILSFLCRMLMWEDGFCRGRVTDCLEEIDREDPVRKAFSKMSIQLYNYGEGWVLGRCFFGISI